MYFVILHVNVFVTIFYRFPRNVELRQRWIDAVRRDNFVPSKTAVLCSAHFAEEDLDRTSASGSFNIHDRPACICPILDLIHSLIHVYFAIMFAH